jgi:M6 family metalloprotease-like protein
MKKFLLFIIFCSTLLIVKAAYLEKYPITLTQPDGTEIACFLSGDEYFNWVHDSAGYTLIRNSSGWIVYAQVVNDELTATPYVVGTVDPAKADLQAWQIVSAAKRTALRQKKLQNTPAKMPNKSDRPQDFTYRTGTLNNIVIYISFPDAPNFTYSGNQIAPLFTDTTRGSSLYSYYRDISNNRFYIPSAFFPATTDTIILSYEAPNPRSYYEIENSGEGAEIEHELLRSAVNFVKTEIEALFTSEQLDYNNDDRVDNICFVIQGNPGAWSSLLWPHRWSLYSGDEVYLHGKRVWDYNLILEQHLMTVGNGRQSVLVHETYHTLGAPDLYRYQDNTINPVGPWCVMSSNTVPPQSSLAHLSNKYGHFVPDIPTITTQGTYTLYNVWDRTDGHNIAYKIATAIPNEYIVLEYRKKAGEIYESKIPNSGILIYRVKTDLGGNADGPPDEVYVYRFGAPNTTTDGYINAAHFSMQSGRTAFSSTTNPPAFLSDDSLDTTFVIDEISASGGATMTFRVTFYDSRNLLPATSLDLVKVYPNPNNGRFNIDFASLIGRYHLVIQDMKGSIVYQEKAEATGSKELNLDLAAGIYILKINSEKGMLIRKIVAE